MTAIPGKGVCMRIRIFGLSMAALVLAPVIVMAALCDDTFNPQSAEQTIWEGGDPTALQRVSTKNISASLSDLQILTNLMAYDVLTKFEGACTKVSKPLNLMAKPGNVNVFKDSVDNGYKVQMFDSTTR